MSFAETLSQQTGYVNSASVGATPIYGLAVIRQLTCNGVGRFVAGSLIASELGYRDMTYNPKTTNRQNSTAIETCAQVLKNLPLILPPADTIRPAGSLALNPPRAGPVATRGFT